MQKVISPTELDVLGRTLTKFVSVSVFKPSRAVKTGISGNADTKISREQLGDMLASK